MRRILHCWLGWLDLDRQCDNQHYYRQFELQTDNGNYLKKYVKIYNNSKFLCKIPKQPIIFLHII